MFHTDEAKQRADEISKIVIGAAIEAHRHLGPGLLESAYESCLDFELSQQGLLTERQIELPVHYKGRNIDCAYRIDLLVENLVVPEIKSIDRLDGIHDAQLLTYLRLSKRWLGLLLNFNVPLMTQGVRRKVCD